MQIYEDNHGAHLRDEVFHGKSPRSLEKAKSLFEAIRTRDHLVHHPYDHFNVVVRIHRAGSRRSQCACH